MEYFKAVNESYNKPEDVYNVLNYIMSKTSTDCIGALNVNLIDIRSIVKEFSIVKNIYNKDSGRQLRHFIVSFSPKSVKNLTTVLNIAYKIALYYKQYQIVFAIHTDEPQIHIHFVMNSVSYVDGRMYREGYEDWYAFIRYGREIISNSIK